MGSSADTALQPTSHTPSTEPEAKLSGVGIAQEPPGTSGQRKQCQPGRGSDVLHGYITGQNDTELAKVVPHSDCGAIYYQLLP